MFDANCHLPLFSSLDEARLFLERAAADGVSDVACAGTDPRHDERVPPATIRVWRGFGVHPHEADDVTREAQLAALETRLEGARAIGECGLDNRAGEPPLDVQERTLRAQLAIARRRELPVVLHLVGAWARAMDILDDEAAREGGPLPAGGVWHAFAGPREAIARARHHGLALSVGGLVLNPSARRLHDALPHIPPELLVVETDMPNAPAVRLLDVVDAVARVLGVPRDDVAARTTANARRIFRIRE